LYEQHLAPRVVPIEELFAPAGPAGSRLSWRREGLESPIRHVYSLRLPSRADVGVRFTSSCDESAGSYSSGQTAW